MQSRLTAELFCSDRVVSRVLELGQAEHEDLGGGPGFQHRLLAALAEHGRVAAINLPIRFAAADAAVAGKHEVELAAGRGGPCRWREAQETCLAAAFGEHAHQLLADARCTF